MKSFSLLAALVFSISAMANSNTVDRTYIGVSDVDTSKKCEVKVRAVKGKVTGLLVGMEADVSDGTTLGFELDNYSLEYKMTQIGGLDGNVTFFRIERSCMNVLCTTRKTKIDLDFNGDELMEAKMHLSSIGTFGLGHYTYNGTCSKFSLQK